MLQQHERLCDWCGRRAVTSTYRTLYEDTEFEQTSQYFECAECASKPTKDIIAKEISHERTAN